MYDVRLSCTLVSLCCSYICRFKLLSRFDHELGLCAMKTMYTISYDIIYEQAILSPLVQTTHESL